jgi:hypothetical protein
VIPPRVPILPPEIQQQLQGEMRAGEKQIWAAQPLPGLYRLQSIGFFIFGLPWTAFAIFWVVSAAGITSHGLSGFGFFPLFGVPFVLIGFAMLSSPFWLGKIASRTVYAITNQRAIVMTAKAFGGLTIQSFEPQRLTSITRNQRADGSGNLVFEQFTQRVGTGTTTVRRGFIGIENVRQVEDLIHATLLADKVRADA